MLVTMKELLREADKGNYAVGAFNCMSLENTRAAVQAAEKTGSPLILQYAEAHDAFIPLKEIGPILVSYARQSTVPVAVHFDHGTQYNKFVEAIKLGFTSVMIDASSMPFEENISLTKEIVKLAHAVDVTVEAELGHVFSSSIGAGETANVDSAEDYDDLDQVYTNPQEAKLFVEETGVDCLAVAFGTVHGVYFSEPHLDLDRVKKIKEAVGIPLVMHGGSGVSEKDYRKAINNGIRKINYYTYANKAGGAGAKSYLKKFSEDDPILFDELSNAITASMKEDIEAAMMIFQNN